MSADNGRTLLTGVAVAAVSGLLAGAGLKPDLDLRREGRAPQIQIPHAGLRSPPAPHETGIAAYGARVPAYVVGTDSLPRPQPQALAALEAPEPADDPVVVYPAPRPYAAPADWVEPPRRRPVYPSIDGAVAYGPAADSARTGDGTDAPAA
jgi:hypothetical protein